MLITSHRDSLCQSVAEVQLIGVAPLGTRMSITTVFIYGNLQW